MFHQGDLQNGITTALQQGKFVVCLVRDDSEESSTWETEWLNDQNIPASLERHAVLLRLEAESQEAGFLAAFCPVTHVPTIIVVYQGQLVEQLNTGVSKNDFTVRLLRAINRNQQTESPESTQKTPLTSHPNQAQSSSSLTAPPTRPSSPSTAPPFQSSTINPTDSLFSDRRARLESQQANAAAALKAAQKARAQQNLSNPASTSTSSPRSAQQVSYQQQQVQRKREAKEERDRILRLVESDKNARKEREERRKAQAVAERGGDGSLSSDGDVEVNAAEAKIVAAHSPLRLHPSFNTTGDTTALQARLLDGSTIRTSFPSNITTLKPAVRAWIDKSRTDGSTAPYTFKQILTPLPSHAISASEEAMPLSELGLAPSATLVLVPVPGSAVSAYGRGFKGGERLVEWVVGLLGWFVNAIYTLLRLGRGGAGGGIAATTPRSHADAAVATSSSSSSSSSSSMPGLTKEQTEARTTGTSTTQGKSRVRIRTLRDQRDEKTSLKKGEQQLYNGNQLNFEPEDEGSDGDEKEEDS